MGLGNCYKILSERTDIPDLLNAMDLFVFPSLSEGLGIAVIEAQKAGVKCVISDAVPDKAIVSNFVKKLKLNLPPEVWAEEIRNFQVDYLEYNGIEDWNMDTVIRSLEKLYIS